MMPETNLRLVRDCVAASARSYAEASIVDSATSTEVLFTEPTGDPESLIVAFRGTREPRDFIMDARFLAKRELHPLLPDGAKVHRGFADGYWGVSAKIIAAIEALKPRRIIMTGHSLGGARALLCAAHLDMLCLPVTDVVTFGAPRVGNAAFRDYYNDRLHESTLRFEAQGDLVPWTPPWLLNGYRHVGRSAYLKNDGSVTIDPVLNLPLAFVQARLSQLEIGDGKLQLFGLFDPHAITNYERLLDNVKEVA